MDCFGQKSNCFEQKKKMYWEIVSKEEYEEIKSYTTKELLEQIEEYYNESGVDCYDHNIMYEYLKRMNVKSTKFKNPCNVQELKDLAEGGMFIEGDKFEVKEILEYPSNKKIKVDSLRKKGLV